MFSCCNVAAKVKEADLRGNSIRQRECPSGTEPQLHIFAYNQPAGLRGTVVPSDERVQIRNKRTRYAALFLPPDQPEMIRVTRKPEAAL
jgi:hypothetical protein